METKKKLINYIIICLIIPSAVVAGSFLFGGKQYAFISAAVTLLACVPFFLSFEKSKHTTTVLVIIAVLTALSVLSRIIFFAIPGFKPVAAFAILAGMYFGSEAGFMTGALSAVLSNIYFQQGPWTPFQMLSWGLVGFAAGMLSKKLKKNMVFTGIFAAVSGILFSLVMDIWSTLWADGYFNVDRYIPMIVASLPTMVLYAVSNIIFLFTLITTIGKRIERLRIKYGI